MVGLNESVVPSLGKGLLDRVGTNLRSRKPAEPNDLDVLAQFRGLHFEPLQAAFEIASNTAVTLAIPVSCTKAIATSPRIAASEVYDRREKSQHGYRAVHVVGEVEGYLVEFQIRTELQHRWAQTFERLADAWGRDLRYGVQPPDLDKTITIGDAPVTRSEVLGFMRDLSLQIYDVESSDARLDAQERKIVEGSDDMSGGKQNQLMHKVNEGRALIRNAANEGMESLSQVLATFEQGGWRAAPAPKGTGSNAILVLYDRKRGLLVDQLEGPSEKLVAVWREWDLQHRANSAMEIVLLTSPSIAELARTHGRYFGSPSDLPRR